MTEWGDAGALAGNIPLTQHTPRPKPGTKTAAKTRQGESRENPVLRTYIHKDARNHNL